jgi:hypothetical protein
MTDMKAIAIDRGALCTGDGGRMTMRFAQRWPVWFRVIFVVAGIGALASFAYAVSVWRKCDGVVVLDALNMPRCVTPTGVIPLPSRR